MKFNSQSLVCIVYNVAPARGRGLKSTDEKLSYTVRRVAPARGRGLKLGRVASYLPDVMSPPQGGVD